MWSKREQWNGRSTKKQYLCSEEEEKWNCVGAQSIKIKIVIEKFGTIKKSKYLCNRYPENNLFTLKD